jgi:hypothetical protein
MHQQELTRFETEAAEIVGAMKELFREFEKRIGEVVSVQRVSASEARTEGAQATQHLQELARLSKSLVDQQRNLLTRIEQDWQLHIDANARRAGEAQAKAFGDSIARGLQERLSNLAVQVEASTRQFTWKSSLRWAAGIAVAIPLTVGICVSAFLPHVEKPNTVRPLLSKPDFGRPGPVNLTAEQTKEAISKLSLCQATKTLDWHPCIDVDSPPRMGFGAIDKPRVVIRGM